MLHHNMVRTNPARYAELYLVPRRRHYSGNLYQPPGAIAMRTREGLAALEECIRELSQATPCRVLVPAAGLSRSAADHVRDTDPRRMTGHTGADGSTLKSRIERYGRWDTLIGENISYGSSVAEEIVIQLLVDDGVPSRGHRRNIMQASFRSIGVSVGAHSEYGTMCVLTYACGYWER